MDFAAIVIALVVATAMLLPSLRGGFLTDDYHNIRTVVYGPKHDENFDESNSLEFTKFFYSIKPVEDYQLYRPIVALSYALNVRLGGTDASSYQVVNLLLHLFCGLLLFLLTRRLLPRAPSWSLAAATLWFLVSPVQLEVVSWTAARSESLSWIFGSLALLFKLAKPDRRFVPALFAAMALMCKESAIAFVPALLVIDLFPIPESEETSWRHRLSRVAERGWPLLLALGLYFAVRYRIFDSFVGKYGEKEIGSPFSGAAFAAYRDSTSTVFFPLSTQLFDAQESWFRVALGILFLAGSALFGLALVTGMNRKVARLFPLLALLGIVPFILATLVNVINEHLVNTRGMYTPFAVLAVLLAATSQHRNLVLRYLPSAFLLAASLLASRPSQELYVHANHGVETTLDSIRDAARELPATTDTIAILGYQELDYFGGGFTASGAIFPALRRPFVDRDLGVLLVRSEEVDASVPYLLPLRNLGLYDGRRTALMTFRPVEKDHHDYVLSHPGAFGPNPGDEIRLVSPPKGGKITLNALEPASLTNRFTFTTKGIESREFLFSLYCATHCIITRQLPVSRTSETPDGTLIELEITVPPEIVLHVRNNHYFIWAITAVDADMNLIAASGIRSLEIATLP